MYTFCRGSRKRITIQKIVGILLLKNTSEMGEEKSSCKNWASGKPLICCTYVVPKKKRPVKTGLFS